MNNLESNRIVRVFAELRAAGRQTLLPFLTAGYPDCATTVALLRELEARDVRVCELGIPFSDPVADGPVIQASYTEALAQGVTTAGIFEAVREYRSAAGGLAILAMVSYSIVFRHGVAEFLAQAARAGIDGLIVPDLPLEEAGEMESLAAGEGLANVMLIAPTTPPERRAQIAAHSRGFIYYVSIAGITGERDRLPPATIQAVAELRAHTQTPVCVGFGISNAASVAEVCKVADGAIVGSAIVHRLADGQRQALPQAQLVRQVGDFVAELLAPLK